jgi:ankyrin repeat protein
LHDAAWRGDVEEIRRIVRSGADIDWRDSIGETALFGAAAWGHVDAVKLLLELGAEPNLQEATGYTPLHWPPVKATSIRSRHCSPPVPILR